MTTAIQSLKVKTQDIIAGGLWRLFPVINVDAVKAIPADYPGAMGVPITFLDKYNPERFELLDLPNDLRLENGRAPYRRVILRNLYPDLPEEIDLAEWLGRTGLRIEADA